jgi:hypothetical protein
MWETETHVHTVKKQRVFCSAVDIELYRGNVILYQGRRITIPGYLE